MSKENYIIIVFELIAEGQCARFLEAVLDITDVARVKVHVHSFVACSNRQIIEVVLNVKAFAMPLDAVALKVPFLRVDKGLHA